MRYVFISLMTLLLFIYGCGIVETPPDRPGYICFNEGTCYLLGNLIGTNTSYIRVGDFEGLVIKDGRILAGNGLGTNRGLFSITRNWSSHLKMFNENFGLVKMGNNGSFFADTNIFCDYVYDNFTMSDSQKPKKVIILTNGDYTSATARISTYINSSCVELGLNPAWDENLTNVGWIERTGMVINFNDGEAYDIVVGQDKRAFFKIGTVGSYAPYLFLLKDVAETDQHTGLELEYEMGNHDGMTAMRINMLAGPEPINQKTITMLNMIGEATQMNNSDGVFINMQMIGNPINASDAHIDGIHMPTGLTHLIDVGSPDTIERAYYNLVDITANITMTGSPVTVFLNDNDVLYIGEDDNFTTIGFVLDTYSNANMDFLFYYCDTGGVWKTLPLVTDTTSGFTLSGAISFENPPDRGLCNQNLAGTPFADVTDYSYIAIQRTRNNILTYPAIEFASITGSTKNMYLTENMLNLQAVDTAPELCTADTLGAIYFDISEDDLCVCKSTGWKVVTDGSNCI